MAQLLAPYNNSMRLGQGFNSYTQQICLDQAVLLNTDEEKTLTAGTTVTLSDTLPSTDADQLSKAYDPRDGSVQSLDSSPEEGFEGAPADHASDLQTVQPTYKANATASQSLRVHPWVKPQIVTYSSRFVDKLSDITGTFQRTRPYADGFMSDKYRGNEHLRLLINQDSNHWRQSQWILR